MKNNKGLKKEDIGNINIIIYYITNIYFYVYISYWLD